MKLQVGERLPGSGPQRQPGGYVVTGVVSETPWYGLYTGKKILYNFDFSSKRVRETDEKEWLNVYLRTIRYPHLDDAEYVGRRRGLARAEVHFVLGNRASNLWPQPIDLLEIVNTRDPFAFSQAGADLEPIVVFARPYGLMLGDWQQQVLPLASILGALAEVLEFLDKTHEEGLLLHGMGPASLLVDRADRVHYVGTDMVIAADASQRTAVGMVPAPQAFEAADWGRLFPPERFPRGFAAPECFQSGAIVDRRTDLYAWGSLAYFVLTGQMPWQIALEQGRPWAHFQEAQFAALEKVLKDVPTSYVTNWLEQLGLGGVRLALPWPQGIMAVLRRLLDPDPQRRPASVAELRRWLVALPPSAIAALAAFRSGPAEAQLFLEAALEADLEVVVRRGQDKAPTNAREGVAVFEGVSRPLFVDQTCPGPAHTVYYAAFTRRKDKKDTTYSAATLAELLLPDRKILLQLAEAENEAALGRDEVPARVRLCFRALDPGVMGEALLASTLPQVRGWALRELQHANNSGPAVALFWRALKDPVAGLRLEAARGILASAPATEELLHRLLWTMGGDSVDGAIEVAQAVHSLGVAEDVLRQALERLEGERAQTCPLCAQQIPARQRPEHLRSVHGHVEVDGSLWPRDRALERLWDKVFQEGNLPAHEQIWALLNTIERKSQIRPKVHPYAAAVEKSLVGRDAAGSGASLGRYIHCLRQTTSFAALVPLLLRAGDRRVRELGREAVLPSLGQQLRGADVRVQDVRGVLEQACPGAELLEEKIQLCYRLPQVGVEASKASACLAQLQEEKLVRCVECEAWVRVGDVEAHLLAAHRIFQFRGERGTPGEMRGRMLDALCKSRPDVAAWRMLEILARARQKGRREQRLVTWVCQRLRKVPRGEKTAVLLTVAEAIVAAAAGERLLPYLLVPMKVPAIRWLARCLALEVAGLLPPPLERAQRAKLLPLLADRHFARRSRQRAIIGLLRSTGKEGDEAMELLSAYVAQTGKLRALDKLRELEQQVGKFPALDRYYSRVEDQVRMACPRCATQLRRGLMVKHLWDRHRLLLDGLRAREPWRVLEDWVVDYRLEKDPALYRRCRDLARQLDGNLGLVRLQQLMLRHGVDDPQARAALLDHAHQLHATLCPKCFHLIPMPEMPHAEPLNASGDELRGHEYRLEISERGPTPWLEIETPAEILFRGREPGRWLTRHGGLVFVMGPLVLATFFVTEILTGRQLPALVILSLALGSGLFVGSLVFLLWPRSRPIRHRLIDAAWTLLVPDLFEEELTAEAASFLASLARSSRDKGKPSLRADAIQSCLERLQERGDATSLTLQTALTRLHAEDLYRAGKDPVPFLVEAMRACFTGAKPLAFADRLLAGLKSDSTWPDEVSERLQVLLMDAAFAARLEISDLRDLALAYPDLAAALNLKDFDSLFALRYLWSLETDKPWERCGKARTVFDLAVDEEAGNLLERYPGLLLAVRGLPMYITRRGLWCKDVCLRERPKQLEIVKLPRGEGYDLVLGHEKLWFGSSPNPLLAELQHWLAYYFAEFLPSLNRFPALHWGEGMKSLASQNALLCPRCRRLLLPCLGEVGITMKEGVPTTWA